MLQRAVQATIDHVRNNKGAMFSLPSRREVSGTYLPTIYEQEQARVRDNIRDALNTTAITIETDGMTYLHRPFINIVAVHPTKGGFPVKIVDCTKRLQEKGSKDARYGRCCCSQRAHFATKPTDLLRW
jgi:hypothetical protein